MRRAAFAGSFDPWHPGHTEIVELGLKMFDEVVVMVADNPVKIYMLNADERVADAKDMIARFFDPKDAERVRVIRMAEGYTADHAKALGCCALLRGLRIRNETTCYEEACYEEAVADFALKQADLPTALVFTSYLVSSSAIREGHFLGMVSETTRLKVQARLATLLTKEAG